jgi:site-specific DNA-methyltransferase (adenine-specific)
MIYNEDCIYTLKNRIEDDSIDLTITSPPYNVDLGNNKLNKNPYDLYNDNKEHQEYIDWLENIFSLIYKKTKYGGRCVINIGDGKNGAVPTHTDITYFMKNMGWIPMSHIIWDKNQVGNRTAWGSFLSPSSPSFPCPYEHILVFGKGNKKLQWKGETDLTKEEFIEYAYGIWKFAPETKMKKIGHPAMYPEELPKRCIKMLSWKDSLIYDPFSGAGTSAIVAKKLGRKFIGSEISEEYYNISINRLND